MEEAEWRWMGSEAARGRQRTELVKFLLNIFELFFLLPFSSNFCSKCGISFLHVYSFPVSFFSASMGLALKGGHCHKPGCVTRHTRHASVTHFRPKSGNPVEVTLMTSPKLYIVSHTKGITSLSFNIDYDTHILKSTI